MTGPACLAALGVALAAAAASPAERSVVVMLFDGFAPALVERYETPALDRMRREGAATHQLIPAFPSVSLVNGVTISTGCWPERHGIVANRFHDPERGLYDHSADADWLLDCEHLHQVAERQGVRAAALGWYGRRSGTRGDLAWRVSDEASFAEFPDDPGRAAQVVRELARPAAERPRLILAYFRGPDAAAHATGLDSDATRRAVEASDASVGAVLAAVDALPDREDVSVVVLTDHGMLPVTHVLNVERVLRRHGVEARTASGGTVALVYLEDPGEATGVAQRLAGHEAFEVILPGQPPPYAHLGDGPRVGDLILSARPPYFVADAERWPGWLRWLGWVGPDLLPASGRLAAAHGYPPETPGMQGILYARGAGIARRALGRIDVVDVHPTVTHLLGIGPGRPVDGRVARALLDESATTE